MVDLTPAYQGSTVIVTGGAGAVGSNLSLALCGLGAKVIVIDNLTSGFPDNLTRDIALIRGSVSDPAVIKEAFAQKPDFLFHLAAQFANANSIDNPLTDLETNAGGTIQLLEAAKTYKGLKKFTLISSSCVYGNSNEPMTEQTPLNPGTPYAVSKLAAEQYVRIYQEQYSLPVVTLRYFNVYGPGERPGKYRNVIPNFIDRALKGLPLIITGTGDETRSFTYVDDIAHGTMTAAVSDKAEGGIFNLGSDQETKIKDLALAINRETGNSAGIEFKPRRGWDEVTRRAVNYDLARSTFGFEPTVDLETGLKRTVDWVRSVSATTGSLISSSMK